MNKPMMRFSGFDDEWGNSIFNSDMYERTSTGPYKIKTEEYCSIGEYPIVDQGKELVVGYHNETANVIGVDDSVIIFGDHTRIFKYIDFDFVPGADGIQVIKLNSNYNTLFVYNRFLLMDIPNMGYSRHFKFLMNRRMKTPSLSEQKLIGNFFKTIDDLISAQEETVEAYELYKEAMLQKMFPKKGKNLSEVRFDGFDDEWEEKKLGDVADVYQPTMLPKSKMLGGKYGVFGANGYVGFHEEYNHKFEQVGISCRGANSGVVNLIFPKTWITGNTMVVNVDKSNDMDKVFLYIQLLSQNLKYMVSGSAQPQIVKSDVDLHKIKVPSIEEQELIGNFFKNLDDTIESHKEKVEIYQQMKEALLQKMFV